MRDYQSELHNRIKFLQEALQAAGQTGFVYGNSGGKDSALVGILCKMACEDTVGIAMPCAASRNFEEDMQHAKAVAEQFGIETRVIDLTAVRQSLLDVLPGGDSLSAMALSNIAPRLRMTTLYAIAASEKRLVVGTDNKSEMYMGYYTKWGDGGYDINPIADLTVTEAYEFLRYLHAPAAIIDKAPSAGLFEGQTDEMEMGVTYRAIDHYLQTGEGTEADIRTIERHHKATAHKRRMPLLYGEAPL